MNYLLHEEMSFLLAYEYLQMKPHADVKSELSPPELLVQLPE